MDEIYDADEDPVPAVLYGLGLVGICMGAVAAGVAAGLALGRGVAVVITLGWGRRGDLPVDTRSTT